MPKCPNRRFIWLYLINFTPPLMVPSNDVMFVDDNNRAMALADRTCEFDGIAAMGCLTF